MPRMIFVAVLAAALAIPPSLSGQEEQTIELLRQLTEAHGPSGYEGPVAKVVRKHLTPVVDSIEIDGLGSMIGIKRGSSDGPRIMMVAHMDEVGFMVKYIDDRGYIYMNRLGGWLDSVLLSQRWTIQTDKGPLLAISGSKTPHVMSSEERQKLVSWDEVFLDIGATSREEATEKFGVRPGDPIAPWSPFTRLNDTDLFVAKAWDDRIGIAVMIEVLKRLQDTGHPNTVYAVATTQEEIGLRGAGTSVWMVEPDIGLSLEVGVAADYPGISPAEAQEAIGKGPGMFLLDSSMIPTQNLRHFVEDVAARINIPLQTEVLLGYGEDGAQIQRFKHGVPAVNLTVPTRYLHAHNGILSMADFDQTVALVVELVQNLDAATVDQIKTFDY